MTDERKIKLLSYLYPNEQIRRFMCNDLYLELEKLIPYSICLSSKNNLNNTRLENLTIATNKIEKLLNENNFYRKELHKFYKESDFKNIVYDILIGYVFYLSCTRRQFKYLDIFLDKRSICYSPISIIDLL